MLLLSRGPLVAQVAPDLLDKPWSGQWITCPDAPERDAFVFHFRKVLELPQAPAHFLVHVSADNQFLLHVNQQRVGTGPALGDLAHWRFETYDLAPFLHSGRNILAATVWGFGTQSTGGQMSDRAGFLLQGDGAAERVADTNDSWEVEEEKGLQPPVLKLDLSGYYAAEPGERIDAAAFDWRWNADPEPASSDALKRWKKALVIDNAGSRGAQMQSTSWQLVPDLLPATAMELIPAGKTVRTSGVEIPPEFRKLYGHLVDMGYIEQLAHFRRECLPIFSRDILKKIREHDASWEAMVPPEVADLIKRRNFFGYRRTNGN